MQFRDLKRQYYQHKEEIDAAIMEVLHNTNFISGKQIMELEESLAAYVERKHCISCANGTDALQLALMALEVGEKDAVFVPDFTFFSTAEVVSLCKATPIFVDVLEDTFNMDPISLENAIQKVLDKGELTPRVVIPVDLFGLPAEYPKLEIIAQKYGLNIIEDGAQGFGGKIGEKKACSFGKISTTSFFPAKPLGCYGDGGAIFTDDDRIAECLKSLRVHGKGKDKYDNVRIGLNSRLDTLQAAILKIKFEVFVKRELDAVNRVAEQYRRAFADVVRVPDIPLDYYSSWAQYSILLKDREERDQLMAFLKEHGIPCMIYYSKPLHQQEVFNEFNSVYVDCSVTEDICERILSLPMHPYLESEEIEQVCNCVLSFIQNK